MPRKKYKYKNLKKIFILLILFFVLYFCFYNYFTNIKNNEYNKITTKNIKNIGINEEIYVYNKNFFTITKDSINLYDIYGNVKWSYTLNIVYDIVITEDEEYICVSEARGKNLYVFNISGLCYEKNFEYPILSFSINNKGYSSVILENKDRYVIYVNDEKGNTLTKGEVKDKNIFPISTAVAKNNKILAISFLDINNFINSKIFFYYINEKETETLLDSMFSSILNLEDQILSKIKFMNNNIFVGISDKQILGIEIENNNTTKVKWNINFDNKITYADFIKNKYITIIFKENINNMENNIKFYNLNGKITGQYNITENINYLKNNFNSIIIKVGDCNKKAYGINNKGKIIFKYNDEKDIKYINFIENRSKLLVVTPTELKVLHINKKK